MSTSNVTPNQDAPDVQVPQGSTPSFLSQTVAPQTPTYDPSDENQTSADESSPQPTSRLMAILQAVSRVGTTALSGVPQKGRSTFVTGLGEGARAEQAAEANQQAIKFKTFDDQIRAAQLHNQDLELQMHTEAQSDAHQAAQDAQHDWDEAHGIQYDEIPNSGQAVLDHLTAQTASGAASIPPGTHLSADGRTILIPKQSDDTQAAQLLKYNTFREVYNLPALPQGAQFVPSKNLDMLQNRIEGHSINGDVYNHDTLPGAIADLQATRDSLAAKSGTSPVVLKQVDSTIKSMQAKLDYLDDHAESVKASQAAAVANATLPAKKALQDNAAANRPQKAPDNTELNAVAFDPNYQNPDGTKGANVVMSKTDAAAKGLTHYKADPSTINATVAGFNDVQTKLNMLADVVNDPSRMGSVQPGVAAAMLTHGKGIQADFHGVGVDTSRINERLYAEDVASANKATKDFVTAFVGAHEAITQLPRLQTFGKSNRMTQQQMEAAQNLLPQPGDGPMASQKMASLQGMLDPLRKQVPHMSGAEQIPSWREKQTRQAPSNAFGTSNLANYVSGLQPK